MSTLSWFDTVALWLQTKEQIVALQQQERQLRAGLFSGAFPNPKEGTNTLPLPAGEQVGDIVLPLGATLKGVHKMNRKIDQKRYAGLTPEEHAVISAYLRFKPELKLKEYKQALDVPTLQPTVEVLHKVMEITPATPELKLHLPGMKEEADEDG